MSRPRPARWIGPRFQITGTQHGQDLWIAEFFLRSPQQGANRLVVSETAIIQTQQRQGSRVFIDFQSLPKGFDGLMGFILKMQRNAEVVPDLS